MLRVGLTGGIGAGKTTVSDKFNYLFGIPVIDADEISRDLMRPGNKAYTEITQLFGTESIKNTGEINREFLRQMIFTDQNMRRKLENIIHPQVHAEINKQVTSFTTPYCLIVIPLLIESNMNSVVDRILVIDACEQNQIDRVKLRDLCSTNDVKSILKAQISPRERLRHADDIITNNGNLVELDDQIYKLHENYLALSS